MKLFLKVLLVYTNAILVNEKIKLELMKHKIISFIKKYWILLIFIFIFSWFILPNCFQNNENLNIISAEHTDSGSILGSIIQMFNHSTTRSFYNQNIPYHTAYYGFPFNSLLFFIFLFINLVFKVSFTNVEIFALTAKLFNFSVAILCIIVIFNLINKLFKYKITPIIYLITFYFFAPFLYYSFHIKSDLLGLLFSLISFIYLYYYFVKPKLIKNIIIANVFAGLAFLCKQPNIFVLIPLFLGLIINFYGNIWQNFKKLFRVYFISGTILILLAFLIHPYIFIEPRIFLAKQQEMLIMTSDTVQNNIAWWMDSYRHNSLFFISAISPFLYILINIFKKKKNINTKFLLILTSYAIVYLIWLTSTVGPHRVPAYFIPLVPISLIFYCDMLDYSIWQINKNHRMNLKFLSFIFFILLIYGSVKSVKVNLNYVNDTLTSVYEFKKSPAYSSTKTLETENKFQKINLIYSNSLPIDSRLYQESTNTWQLPTTESISVFKPNYIFVDLTTYWEKPYDYWKNIALQNDLNNEKFFLDNVEKEKNIILFY